MVEAVYHQSAFSGGEWSPLAQGRSDLAAYKTAMNVCLNGIPATQGAWVRRSGTFHLGPTIARTYSKLARFVTDGAYALLVELGDAKMRFFKGYSRVSTSDDRTVSTSSSTAGTLSVTLDSAHGWSAGDTAYVDLSSAAAADAGLYLNRLMTIATASGSDLTLVDDLGDAFDFDSASNALAGCTIKRLREFATPWSGTSVLPYLRVVQASDKMVVLSATAFPQALPVTDSSGIPTFGSLANHVFLDGPYLKAQETSPDVSETGSVSAYSGTITFTPAATTFDANDVGRLIRLFNEPADWDAGTTYSYGSLVTYQNGWWMSVASGTYASSNVGFTPGSVAVVNGANVVFWVPAPQAGGWAWGTITAQATTSCTVALSRALNAANGTSISEWRLGVYKIGRYPTCGTYHNGRLLLAGAVPNRIDASKSNDDQSFAPTDEFGNVEDDNAIGMVLNFDEQQAIHWIASDARGVIVGTTGGEILITSDGGLTPFDREAKKMTRFQCFNAEPCRAGDAVIFLQRYNRRLVEYRPNDFGNRFVGAYLNEFSQHLTVDLLQEITYQQSPLSVLWCRDKPGRLTGLSYQRDGANLSVGAHRHELSDDARRAASLCVIPVDAWFGEALFMVTATTGSTDIVAGASDCAIEMLLPPLPEI